VSDALDQIKQLYYKASKTTILADFDRAIDLLKSMPSEEERERAVAYMDGLAQLRAQWTAKAGAPGRPGRSGGPGRPGRSRGSDASATSSRVRR